MRASQLKRCGSLVLAAAGLLAAIGLIVPAVPSRAGGKHQEGTDSLHEVMETLGGTFRKVRRQVRKAEKNAATAELLVKMEQLVMKAKSARPTLLATMPAGEQGKKATAYRLKMIDVLMELLKAEKAVLEARNDDAYTSVKRLAVLQSEGHEIMGVED